MPPPQQIARPAAPSPEPTPESTPAPTPAPPRRPLRCELAEHHPGEHAELLWEDDRLGGALWVRWTDTRMYRVMLFWCTHTDELGDACGLFDNHPSAHSWRIIDTAEDGPPELPLQRGDSAPGGEAPPG